MAIALVTVACGKKGPPLPPLVKLPVAPADFTAARRANGLLTGEEIGGLDLSRCDLAVLSACESGLGRISVAARPKKCDAVRTARSSLPQGRSGS